MTPLAVAIGLRRLCREALDASEPPDWQAVRHFDTLANNAYKYLSAADAGTYLSWAKDEEKL